MSTTLKARWEALRQALEQELAALLPPVAEDLEPLRQAMAHAVLGGGKRIRALLVELVGAGLELAPAARLRVAAAVELLHAYSLVHDDLPAMDDAALRRGRPTVHRAFGEDVAILAGDALQALAFEVLAREDWPAPPEARSRLVVALARAAGLVGMCGGQYLDLHPAAAEVAAVEWLQRLKTGALFGFCVEAPAILQQAPAPIRSALGRYAEAFGLAFQITDDLLDLEGASAHVGKDTGRDAAAGKATLVALLGAEGARRRLRQLQEEARAALAELPFETRSLEELFHLVIERRR